MFFDFETTNASTIDDETLLASILEGGDALHRDMRQYYQESLGRTEVLNLLEKRGASITEAERVQRCMLLAISLITDGASLE